MWIVIWISVVLAVIGYVWLFRHCVFILVYHGVGTEQTGIPGLVIRPESFRKHVRVLSVLGLRSEFVDAVVQENLSGKVRMLPRLCITFDDGYKNIRYNALGILREKGWAATVFVPTDFIGKSNEWDRVHKVPPIDILSWSELRELSGQEVCIGSHGKSHSSLTHLSGEEAAEDARSSLSELKARLPNYSRVFCYPYGHCSAELFPILREAGYIGACCLVSGALPDPRQVFDIGRLVVRSDSLFRFVLDLALYPLKSLLRRLFRHAGRGRPLVDPMPSEP